MFSWGMSWHFALLYLGTAQLRQTGITHNHGNLQFIANKNIKIDWMLTFAPLASFSRGSHDCSRILTQPNLSKTKRYEGWSRRFLKPLQELRWVSWCSDSVSTSQTAAPFKRPTQDKEVARIEHSFASGASSCQKEGGKRITPAAVVTQTCFTILYPCVRSAFPFASETGKEKSTWIREPVKCEWLVLRLLLYQLTNDIEATYFSPERLKMFWKSAKRLQGKAG